MSEFDPLRMPPRVTLANFYPFAPGEVTGPHWSESDLYLPATNGRGEILLGPRRFELNRGQVLHVPWAAPILYRADRRDPFVLIGLHFKYVLWTDTVSHPLHTSRNVDMTRRGIETCSAHRLRNRSRTLFSSRRHRTRVCWISALASPTSTKALAATHPMWIAKARLQALALEFLVEVRACAAATPR